ncbi:sensor histidine kinase [Orrella dioscoreae]|uniref:C4-dicarboxylate transport sensor protein DctB n=1 Tax=Orrella dioscoreae TaxID=1851544 RepID=A0A1C3K3G4_9BURK|nr:ATP-binding protein [Orrella dioscoreae]SBT26053.1 C4-dicarboxylate transport sensor protein dctB [Orrella dioscoreae]SOE48804.1 C4-dicarboxylate transport sensor protein dctB [Orrella dioscoreae]
MPTRFPPPPRVSRRGAWLLFALAVIVLALTWTSAGRVGSVTAHERVVAQAQAVAQGQAQLLESELNKFRTLPFVLAQDRQLRDVLRQPTGAALATLNAKLEGLPAGTGASVVYLLNQDGLAIAASNWRTPTSFAGVHYGFRPYFKDAWQHGTADYFALGTASRLPGLYQSRRIDDDDGQPLGVLVVKVEFHGMETIWRKLPQRYLVHDEEGIILFGSQADWRFLTLSPVTAERARVLRDSLQFGDAPLTLLPWRQVTGTPGEVVIQGTRYAEARQAITGLGWTLRALVPVAPVYAEEIAETRQASLLACLLALAVAATWLLYRRRRQDELALQKRQRATLEALVQARTEALRDSNAQLTTEMADRQRTQARARALQAELEQANKLSLLGQISAGVAHEINQPLAAIRTYAENAGELLRQQRPESAGQALDTIVSLTERIGHITGELRGFARKPLARDDAVRVRDAVDGALLLLAPRARQLGVRLHTSDIPDDLLAQGERVRLEQILVNLLQNALDALAGRDDGFLRVRAWAADTRLYIEISDNGPGLSATARATLFTPFSSERPAGLGLGLVISRDIARELGGELDAVTPRDGGATFLLQLRKADAA